MVLYECDNGCVSNRQRMLSSSGWEVFRVTNVDDALRLIERFRNILYAVFIGMTPAEHEPIRLLEAIVDMPFPRVVTSAYQLSDTIKQKLRDLGVIAIREEKSVFDDMTTDVLGIRRRQG